MTTNPLKGIVLSEKAAYLGGARVYSFWVADESNKAEISAAITAKYKVHPTKVNIIRTATRTILKRGRASTLRGSKKALVTLPAGEVIDFA
jgi:ribosomal protein L23